LEQSKEFKEMINRQKIKLVESSASEKKLVTCDAIDKDPVVKLEEIEVNLD
jgi:hypothetical protein